MDITGAVISLDGAYDSKKNRKMIFNAGMVPNINENKRNRKSKKRGRKRLFDQSIFKERFRTIERVFSWEDKFKRLLLRFEYHSIHHYHLVASFITAQPHSVNFLTYYLKRINPIPPVFIIFSDECKFSHLSTSFDNRIPWRIN